MKNLFSAFFAISMLIGLYISSGNREDMGQKLDKFLMEHPQLSEAPAWGANSWEYCGEALNVKFDSDEVEDININTLRSATIKHKSNLSAENIQAYYQKVKRIPAKEVRANMEGYSRLICMAKTIKIPSEFYEKKHAVYEAKYRAQEEQKSLIREIAVNCRIAIKNAAIYGVDFDFSNARETYKTTNGYKHVRELEIENAYGNLRKTQAICYSDNSGNIYDYSIN